MSIVSINATDVSKITSGQVIVDLTSAVKELVDNAIDARADKIEITFSNHGSRSVEVSDNGHGIDPSDFETLCLKYHTSKLTHFEDLASVATLGFRGEAMSSLCSVAKVKVSTCSKSTFPRATQLEYGSMGGVTSKKTSVSGKKGTTVSISDLFHGMPVRQKNFVKHVKREYAKTLTLLSAYLLAYTNIRFTIFNISGATAKKSMVMGTQGGKSTVTDVLTTIYGSNGAHGLIPLDICVQNIDARFKINSSSVPVAVGIKLTGVISDYSFGMGRAATDRQFLSINRRPVTHKKLTKIINEVYKAFNTTQSPVFVLDLELDSQLIDINVTPDKRSIMMQCDDLICGVIREELTQVYEGRNNFLPKSQMGVVNIGTQSGAPQRKNLDSFRSSQSSFDETQREVSEDEEEAKEAKESHFHEKLEITQVFLEPQDNSFRRDETENMSVTNQQSKTRSVTPPNSREEVYEILASECGSENGESDHFEDIDENKLNFSSPLRPTKGSKDLSNFQSDDTPVAHSQALFVQDEEYDASRQNTQNIHVSSDDESETEDGAARKVLSPNGPNLESEADYYSSKGFSDHVNDQTFNEDDDIINHIEEQNNAPEIGHIPNSESNQHTTDSSQADRPDRFLSDQLQGISKTLAVQIEDAKTFLSCSAEPKIGTRNLASVQDINEAMEIRKDDFTKMEIVGQFNSGFIIVIYENKLFIVDQHASDEIYNYERLMNDLTLKPQPLMAPQVLELSPIDEMKILEFSEHLMRNGFSIEEIDDAAPGRRVRLMGIPVSKNVVFDVSDLHELVHKLHEQGGGIGSRRIPKQDHGPLRASPLSSCRCTKVDRMIASRACRSSIMIGSALSSQTMSKVVKNLATLDRPWNCPHGRPTMRHLADIQGTGFSEDYEI